MVYLPNGNGPGKKYFPTTGKILHLTEKCEIKLNKIQNYVIVLFSPLLLIDPNSPVYSIAASFDLTGLSCHPLPWIFTVISHLAKEQRN